MFLRNKTRHHVGLSRTTVSDSLSVTTAVVISRYKIEPDGLVRPDEVPLRPPPNVPDPFAYPLWKGVSVTATGCVLGPSRGPFVRPVTLSVGAESLRLAVFGDRRWKRSFGGGLVASDPEAFESIPLVFHRAFGGAYKMPPGLFPGTDLPFPGVEVSYPLNPSGIGFYETAAVALEQPLPNIELVGALVRAWDDRPEPAGFAPCMELPALRVPTDMSIQAVIQGKLEERAPGVPVGLWATGSAAGDFDLMLRMIHHAPGRLIFPRVPPKTPVCVDGMEGRTLRFDVQPSPIRVEVQGRSPQSEVPFVLRSIHVDVERRIVDVVNGHSFYYVPQQAPGWVRVLERET